MSTPATATIVSITNLSSTGGTVNCTSKYGSCGGIGGGIIWSTSHNPTTTVFPYGGRYFSNAQSWNMNNNVQWYGTLYKHEPIPYDPPEHNIPYPEVFLVPGVTYYVRAFVYDSCTTSYSSESTFVIPGTPELPTVSTNSVSGITQTTAIAGGNVTADGSSSAYKGVCWSTSHNPTIANSKTSNGFGVGSYTSSITGLTSNTTYYVRAYATNYVGTSYGSEVSFTTYSDTPQLTTTAITNITKTTASGGGNITYSGASAITAKGVCWNTTGSPTLANSKTIDGGGVGVFTSTLTGLTSTVVYYVRAYATNSYGTSYGNQISFLTAGDLPTVSTSAVTITTINTASAGGLVITSGDSAVTARGVCWSTNHLPTLADSKTIDGSGLGAFTSTLTGLSVNTTYYIRAYATNTIGTSYGNEDTFGIEFIAPTLSGNVSGDSINLSAYNVGLHSEHFELYYSGLTNLVARVPFNESSGATANDYSGNNYDGTLSSNSSFVNSGRNGGYCVNIPANNYVDFGNNFQYNVDTTPFTMAIWVYNSNPAKGDILGTLCNSSGTYLGHGLNFGFGSMGSFQGNKLHFYRSGNNNLGRLAYANQALGSGWHHLAVTYDGSNTASGLTLYYDGNKLTTLVYSDSPAGGAHGTFRIGNGSYFNYYGLAQDFLVFDKELTEDEISNIYINSEHQYITTIDVQDFTYTDTNLGCGEYNYIARCKADSVTPILYTDYSNVYSQALIIAPSDLTCTTEFTGLTLTWTDNNTDCVIEGNRVYQYSGSSWVEIADVPYSASTYSVSGLTPNQLYQFRVGAYSGTSEYTTSIFSITTLDPTPYNLLATNVSQFTADLTWDLIAPPLYGTSIEIRLKLAGQSLDDLQTVASISPSATTYTLTGLMHNTAYDAQVVRIGSEYPSSLIRFTTLDLLPSFCTGNRYSVGASTCGANTGSITIADTNYFLVYDFTLTDIEGNSYTFDTSTGAVTGLSSNFYFLTASPKSEYALYYDRDCVFNWIEIADTDTTLSLLSVRTKMGFCGGFGNDEGRITIRVSDSGTTTGLTMSLYNDRFELVDQQLLTGSTFTAATSIVSYPSPDVYYIVIENDSGCKILIPRIVIQKEDLYTTTGIKRLWLTPWTAGMSYNYYSSEDEDWYVTGVDTLQYTSTKIKEFVNLSDFWYEIILDTATMTYAMELQRGSNGLTYNETVTVTIPCQDNAKWKELVNVLTQSYTIVFQDNNDKYWTSFYHIGATVKSYRLADNQYTLVFQNPSVSKMLTGIDEAYIKNHIL